MSVPKYIDTYDLDSTAPSTLAGPVTVYVLFKRLIDLALIVAFSPVILPFMLLTAIIIKLESKGPVFFWQKRVGVHGKTFNMVKFRSMTIDSEKDGSQFAENGDKRVTRFGRFTRKMRIDELPQLWNIIQGDMSLIGPRPEQVSFVQEFEKAIPRYASRHVVRPGITGLAQVEQGYVDDEEGTRTKLIYDLHYIDNLSLKMDITIVGKTIYTMATGFGAR
jgi:lipopolysaccharide/colanic/teichoic acid biosynthesis glycosyltransferase